MVSIWIYLRIVNAVLERHIFLCVKSANRFLEEREMSGCFMETLREKKKTSQC